MPGGAFSFAEVLRDEYFYLAGAFPRLRATIEPKHLREVPQLVLRIGAAPDPQPRSATLSRHSLLKQYFEAAPGGDDHRLRLTNAFTALLSEEELEIRGKEDVQKLTLFDALLLDREIAPKIRTPFTLRKLVGVAGARRVVFSDRECGELIVARDELLDVFRAQSAAVRILTATAGGREMFSAYPALLSTIADDPDVERLLTDKQGESRRGRLLDFFSKSRRSLDWYYTFLPLKRDIASQDGWRVACDAAKLKHVIAPSEDPPSRKSLVVPLDCQTIFNATLLETAFVECFTDSYDLRSMNAACHEKDMAALCLSGGGIRSATFNLGILQGLADHGLLQKFQYLSTVSGGGYIGSWLSSWVRRHPEGVSGVAEDLSATSADPEEPEVKPIQHLRSYSSYLAPRATAFSADTWTLVTIYLRNLLLNWTLLLPVVVGVLALPRLMQSASFAAWQNNAVSFEAGAWAVAFGFSALVILAWRRPAKAAKSGAELTPSEIRLQRFITALWRAPLIASAVAFCLFWASLRGEPRPHVVIDGWMMPLLLALASGGAGTIYSIRRLFARAPGGLWKAVKLLRQGTHFWRTAAEVAATTAAGFLTGWLLRILFANIFPPAKLGLWEETLFFEQFVTLGVPLFLFTFFVEATLLAGFTTRGTNDDDREWWARSAALIFLNAILFLVLAACAILLPILVAQLPKIVASLGGISAVTAWVLARSEKLRSRRSEDQRSSALLGMVLKVAAATTLVLILALLSLLTTFLLSNWHSLTPHTESAFFGFASSSVARLHLGVLQNASTDMMWNLMWGAAFLASLMSILLDVNVYSMHGMYRNRLIRSYLGASRWSRRGDPFTGFDPQDNVDMFELRAEALWTTSFVDFDKFARELRNHAHLFRQMTRDSPDVASRLDAFVNGPVRPPAEEICCDVVRVLNERMVTHDLRHDVATPRSAVLFTENRRYLESNFPDTIMPAPWDDPVVAAAEPFVVPNHSAPEAIPVAPSRSEYDRHIYEELEAKVTAPTERRRRPPIHIVNAALNLVGGDNLAWQERKADSFTISPLHCGNRRLGYRDSFDYGDQISLGTAMAISGAAVSPNMGYHSSPIVTFLMTLFNARLGWWLGNPSAGTYKAPGPRSTLTSIYTEALSGTNDTSDYVFLSDGGHFDNLGLYEMVRRRCHYIVLCDASADGKYVFGDLGKAVRKIRIDMGIPITLRTSYVAPEPGQKQGRYCAVGLIHYGNADQVSPQHRYGHLIYIKPAVDSECPPDVSNYKNESDWFPHESTLDQFFGESQFESYRTLGRHIIGRICADEIDRDANPVPSVAAFVLWAKEYIDRHRTAVGNVPVQSMDDVVSWMHKSLRG